MILDHHKEDDDVDDATNEEYLGQDNVVVGTFAPNEMKIETLPNDDDDQIVDVGTYEEVHIVGVKHTEHRGGFFKTLSC